MANISEHELARRTGIKQPIIHRLLSGENTNPKLSTLKPLADYFMISIGELIGEADIAQSWSGFTASKHKGWREVPLIEDWNQISLPSQKKAATKGIVVDCSLSPEAFSLFARDESMEPLFPKGSIIIIEPTIIPENGDYILIMNENGEAQLRQFHLVVNEKYITPLNKMFGKISKIPTNCRTLGVVIRTIFDHRTIVPL